MFKLLVMSMMFSAVAGCPQNLGSCDSNVGAAGLNCLRIGDQLGHLEITDDTLDGVSWLSGTSGVLVVLDNAFRDCTTLKTVSMPKVTKIKTFAFVGTSLTSVTMSKVTTILNHAFAGTSLTSVSMPLVTSIGSEAFVGTGLTWVHMPLVERIGDSAFDGTPYSTKNPWQDKTALKVQYSSIGC